MNPHPPAGPGSAHDDERARRAAAAAAAAVDDNVRRICAAKGWCTPAGLEEAESLRRDLAAQGETTTLLDALVLIGAIEPHNARALRAGELASGDATIHARKFTVPSASVTPRPLPRGAASSGPQAAAHQPAARGTEPPPQGVASRTAATIDFDAEDLAAARAPQSPARLTPRHSPPPAPVLPSRETPDATRTTDSEATAFDTVHGTSIRAGAAAPVADAASFGIDLPGRTLGGCRIEHEIGRGAMGVVFEATHLALQRKVALKVLMPTAHRNQRDVEQFVQEARALAKIEHQNIVQVFDVGQQDGLHYLTMQLLQGETVADRIDRQRAFSWEEGCKLARDAAKGLAVAHEKGIVHRDIKPENLFITTDGVVKIADFGLAAQAAAGDDGTRTEVMGTPAYMSPEQIDGCNVDGRADLYSLGCTLYVMLTGKKPFSGDTAIEVLLKQTKEIAPPVVKVVPSVPLSVSQVIEKLMAKHAGARYQKAADLAADLEKILGGGKPKVVVEIEDVMGRMQDLAREVSAPQTSLFAKPAFVLACAAAAVAVTATALFFALPGIDGTALADGANLPSAKSDAEAEARAREALAAVDAFAAEFPDRPDLFTKRYDELDRQYGDVIGVVISANRETALHKAETRRVERIQESRRAAAAVLQQDPIAAVRALLSVPEEMRTGTAADEWGQDLERAVTAIRVKHGMVYIPAGKAKIGADNRERSLGDFLIDVTEVTNDQWAAFVRDTGARAPRHWAGDVPPPLMRELPVVGITAAEAEAYAKWAGKRLPTAAEWERAARGPDGLAYPWGAEFDGARCVARAASTAGGDRSLAGVQTFSGGRSAEGLYHMAGNAFEWTADSSADPLVGVGREVRGGSSKSHPASCAATVRYWVAPETDDPELLIGFRCAK